MKEEIFLILCDLSAVTTQLAALVTGGLVALYSSLLISSLAEMTFSHVTSGFAAQYSSLVAFGLATRYANLKFVVSNL